MEQINITDKLGIEDVPCCPLCGQPIEFWMIAAIGTVIDEDMQSSCLVHEECAKE